MPHKTIEEIRREIAGKSFERSMYIDRATAVDEENRTVSLAFASDKPCETWFGDLITTVSKKAIRSERLKAGLALLLDHERTQQIGIVESFSFDNDGVARALVRFSRSASGEEIFQDVKDGVRRSVSVGFYIHEMHLEKQEDDKPDLYRSDDWEPIEISIVSIPADISVGVGRSQREDSPNVHSVPIKIQVSVQNDSPEERAISNNTELKTMSEEKKETPEAPVVETAAAVRSADELATEEITRWGESLGCPDLAKRFLTETFADEKDITVKAFKAFVKSNHEAASRIPVPSAEEMSRGFRPGRVESRADVKSIGDAFINSALYKSTVGKSRQRGLTVAVDVPMMPAQMRATFDSASTGLQSYIDYAVGPILIEQQRLTVRDLLSVGQTNLSSVPYIQETSYTNAATTVGEEGEKPEATFALQDEFAPVRKIAVIAKVTDEMWNDFPTLRDYINSRLRFMVEEREEAQLLSGAGTGSEITGILTAAIQAQALAADTHADAVHKAITKIRTVGHFEPDGAVFHPDDWQQMRLAKDDNNQYYGGGPFSGPYGNGPFQNAERYWGLPVVVTTAITSGTGLVGAFKLGAQIWDREGITVDATNSDEDDFRFNRMAIRVEERLALAIYRLTAFCKVTGI